MISPIKKYQKLKERLIIKNPKKQNIAPSIIVCFLPKTSAKYPEGISITATIKE
jgi:hypothetical protein